MRQDGDNYTSRTPPKPLPNSLRAPLTGDTVPVAPDLVNHPPHYQAFTPNGKPIEAIEVIEAFNLGFNLGNVVKYICRANKKGATLQDLEKACWYIKREIETRKTAESVARMHIGGVLSDEPGVMTEDKSAKRDREQVLPLNLRGNAL